LKIPLANNHADINQMTNYRIIANAQNKLHVCLQAERKEDDNNDDGDHHNHHHYNTTLQMTTTKTTNRLWYQSICLLVCVKISFPVVNCLSMTLLCSFSDTSNMFQALALK
jgi:hypothetical protein